MTGETGAAGVWAALMALSFLIAATITAGYWIYVYHDEAQQMQPFLTEPCTTVELILDDIPVLRH
jgi:hypothetical protein